MSLKRFMVSILFASLVVAGGLSIFLAETDAQTEENDSVVELGADDLEKVVTYIVELIMKDPGNLAFASEQVEEATGVAIPEDAGNQIQAAVIARLQETPEGSEALALVSGTSGASAEAASGDGAACTTSGNRCVEYAACSLYGDLAGATGETLEMYKAEKAKDGEEFDDFPLPEFEAMDLAGNTVHSSDLIGKPTVLVMLAGHCGHSIAAIGVLQKVADEYRDQNVRVVGVFLNSGTAKKVKPLVGLFDVDYEVWVYPDDSLGNLFDSHLVPTYLYVSADGLVKKKLVGQKSEEEIGALVAGYSD